MILDMIEEWFRELLIDGIISNLTGMFDTLNTKVGEIAGEVGMTPSAWNSGIFNMVRNLSETVIVPIAGIVLTFVFRVSNIPVRFEMIPSMSSSWNHSCIASKINGDHLLLQYIWTGKPGSQSGFPSISCLSYNERSNWLTNHSLGLYVRVKDC